jgi:hypothetical protein
MVNRTYLALLGVIFCARSAAADEPSRVIADANADTNAGVERTRDRIGVYGTVGMGALSRPGETVGGGTLGGEVALVLGGLHGLRVGYAYSAAVFGPEVHVFDLDYTIQWNSHRRMKGVTGSVGLMLGPSVASVSYGGNQPDGHATFGGRVGAFADLNLWMVTLGLDLSGRLGLSSAYGAESLASVGLHAGLTFDVAPIGR